MDKNKRIKKHIESQPLLQEWLHKTVTNDAIVTPGPAETGVSSKVERIILFAGSFTHRHAACQAPVCSYNPCMKKRIIIGISGASGTVFGIRALEMLRAVGGIETHLVMSRTAMLTAAIETDLKAPDILRRADHHYLPEDIAAPIASGSFPVAGMIVAPCSIRTLGEIVTGMTSSLLTRAADVTLKERRPLVLMVRETPLHLGHLRSMAAASEMGAIIAPPVPAFYNRPQTLEEMLTYTTGRALEALGLQLPDLARWTGVRKVP
jgi:4-hydroxy-3-polyprenylbenzoate decarboxylase